MTIVWDTTAIHYKNLSFVVIAYLPVFYFGWKLTILFKLKKWDCVLIFVLFTVWMKYLMLCTVPQYMQSSVKGHLYNNSSRIFVTNTFY